LSSIRRQTASNQRRHLLFNNLVGAGEQLGRHAKAERFRRLEIDHQFNLGTLLDRKISRLGARENFSNIDP